MCQIICNHKWLGSRREDGVLVLGKGNRNKRCDNCIERATLSMQRVSKAVVSKTSLLSVEKSEAGFLGLVFDFFWKCCRKMTQMIQDLENMVCAERLKDLCVFV